MNKKALLIILDGWGLGDHSPSDLIHNGNTPFFKHLLATQPNSQLDACGEYVGLPDGQMGNSEVGHLNIGAGRVVYQDLVRINMEVRDNKMPANPQIKQAMKYAKNNNKAVHFIGLVSDGGVHSLDKHLYKLCDIATDYKLDKVYIHALLDGRDTDPRSGKKFMQNLVEHIKTGTARVASVCGRYYTMDRDQRWKRIKAGYDLMTEGIGIKETDPVQAIENSYANNITDEFVKPTVIVDAKGQPLGTIQPDDVVICFNFRTDRLREITSALTQWELPEHGMHIIPLQYYTMTCYDERFRDVNVIYDKENVAKTLGEVVSNAGIKQLRIAETEKYAHVTFFFSGGMEGGFGNETHSLVASPKVATYDLQPEMSAYLVKNQLIKVMDTKEFGFIVLNFANGDMVGHTGVKEAILKAVEVVDNCVKDVVESALKNDYDCLLIADHGNADFAINADGSPNTAHSLNKVPCVYISNDKKFTKVENGKLADVAPTMLAIMGLKQPKEMTGKNLLS